MDRRFSALSIVAGMCVVALVAMATPAYAQLGSLKGKIVDEAGKPVADVDISLDYTGEMNLHFTAKSDKNGVWTRAGLLAIGRWKITAKKGDLIGIIPSQEIYLGGAKEVVDIVLRPAGAVAGPGMDAKKKAEATKILAEVNVALAANDYDVALAKLTEATTKIDKCTECYLRLGDVYTKKTQLDKAEEAYKQAIGIDEKSADAYEGLAVVYNTQKKFDEAGTASAKATELRGASGGAGDATSAYNSGVIFWNQSKIPEAKVQFQKAVQMNPAMAEAHYYFGMCLVNEGKVAEAKTSLETYLKLAPAGPNAATAKAILDSMK